MKVAVENIDRIRKNIQVVLDEDKIVELREEIYNDLKKHAKIKGFRPGKVPRSVIQSFYKDYIEDELKRKIIEETMGAGQGKGGKGTRSPFRRKGAPCGGKLSRSGTHQTQGNSECSFHQ